MRWIFLSIIIKLPSPSTNPDTQLLFCILLTGNRGRVVNLRSGNERFNSSYKPLFRTALILIICCKPQQLNGLSGS